MKSENVRTPAMRSSLSEMPYLISTMSRDGENSERIQSQIVKRGFIGDLIGFDAVVRTQVLDDVAFDVVFD